VNILTNKKQLTKYEIYYIIKIQKGKTSNGYAKEVLILIKITLHLAVGVIFLWKLPEVTE